MTINEEKITRLVTEELSKSDVVNMFKNDKDFEKKVKEIITDVLCEMFRVLWQHNSIFKVLSR